MRCKKNLVEDFLQFLRHERGQSDNTAKTYAALLGKFITWAEKENLSDWKSVELKHLMAFLQYERARNLLPVGRASARAANNPEQGDDGSRTRPTKIRRSVLSHWCLSGNRRVTRVL